MDDHTTAILFDIDGCLISTGGAGARAWRHAFESLHGIPADIGRFSEAGMTDPDVGRLTFQNVIGRDPSDREMARLMAAYLDRLTIEVEESPGYRVMPGVVDLLPHLVEIGVLLGLTSGALEAGAHIKLARAGLNRYFCFGGYGSDSRDRAELTRRAIERAGVIHGHALDPGRVVVVGDTPLDIAAARANAAVSVGVATGKYSVEQLRASGADHALADLTSPLPDLPDLETAKVSAPA